MQHPQSVLTSEYTSLLAIMKIRKECQHLVDEVATRLLTHRQRYQEVTDADGVPVIFIATSFEREASSDFKLNPAQGWPLTGRSKWIPHNGPFKDWKSAAIAAYHLNGLDKIGNGNWIWPHICYYGEVFNGMGYRDFHHMHSPYLWGGTNIQTVGKYDLDGKFNPEHMDPQLGIIPVARRMVELDPTLALPEIPYVPVPPIASGFSAVADADAKWVQSAINMLGRDPPLDVDGNYGRQTKLAVEAFQSDYGLDVDGVAGTETIAALRAALANQEVQPA